MSGILRLESLTKGNTLKQGDKTPLKYRLFDADGDKLDISGKPATVRLMKNDFTVIAYEKEGLTVASDDTISFNINKILPGGLYHLEVIVDDKYIFPSRSDEGKFNVDKSSLGAELTIIENAGIDAVVRKAVDLINKDPNLIIDEDKLVSDIISNTGIGSIEEYHQQFNDVIKELSEEKDYHSLPEIAGARGGEDTLGERLNKEHNEVTVQLAQKVGGNTKAKLTDLSEEVLGALSGGAEFNLLSIPQDRSVNLDKLGIDEYIPRGLKYTLTNLNTRAISEEFTMQAGDTVRTLGKFSYSLYRLPHSGASVDDAVWATSGWLLNDTTVDTTGIYILRVNPNTGEAMENSDLITMTNTVYVTSKETAVKHKEIDEIIDSLSLEIDEVLSGESEIQLEHGDVDGETFIKINDAQNYVRPVLVPIQMSKGDKITLLDTETYGMALATNETRRWIDGWNTTEYTADQDTTIVFIIRKKVNGIIDLSDIQGKVILTKSSRVATMNDLYNFIPVVTKVRYVSTSGSDTNSGTSQSEAFATLQKALDEGADTIYVQAGTYYGQSVNKEIDKVSILVYGATEGNTQAVFKGSDLLDNWESSSGVYRTPYTGNDRFNRVFVSKTLPIETASTRPTYNVVLWEGNDGETDYKMKPVLTLSECQAEVGTFYYDGNYVYINPKDINSEFNATKLDTGMVLTGDELVMKGIVFDFYTGNPMRITHFKSIDVFKSGGNHSSSQDGWNLNYSFGRLSLCDGFKNRNDGFNTHWVGDIILENCRGINNYDDGASPHEDCSMTFYGGEYRGNVKGGISPIQQARVSAYGVKIIDNGWTLWNNTDTGIESNYVNCLMLNNDNGIMSTLGGKVTLINCVEQDNGADQISGGSIVEKY